MEWFFFSPLFYFFTFEDSGIRFSFFPFFLKKEIFKMRIIIIGFGRGSDPCVPHTCGGRERVTIFYVVKRKGIGADLKCGSRSLKLWDPSDLTLKHPLPPLSRFYHYFVISSFLFSDYYFSCRFFSFRIQ